MARRLPSEDESQFAFWSFNRRQSPNANKRVLVAHKDRAVGESISMLLRLKGMDSAFAQDHESICELLQTQMPAVVLMDTRLDAGPNYEFMQRLRSEAASENLLMVAMSNFFPHEPIEALQLAGFDGHFRRPCETWRVIDVLVTFLEYSRVANR